MRVFIRKEKGGGRGPDVLGGNFWRLDGVNGVRVSLIARKMVNSCAYVFDFYLSDNI